MPEDIRECRAAFLFVMTGEGWMALPGGGQGYRGTPYNARASIIQPRMSAVLRVRNAAVQRREEKQGKALISLLRARFDCGVLWARTPNEGAGAGGGVGAQEDASTPPVAGLPESGVS